MITENELKKLIECGETNTIDFKSFRILSDVPKLAELMVAFGNNKFISEDFGGRIIIGVTDDAHQVEDFKIKSGHEESIMNVARDKIYPGMNPSFDKVSVDEKMVYVITIPKMINIPYQLIERDGNTHRIRVGTTVREPTFQELDNLYNKNEQKLDEKIDIITSKFPGSIGHPFRHISIIPFDSNAQMIFFGKENTEWLKANHPKTMSITDKKLIQNEIHYKNKNFPGSGTDWGIINEQGYFSLFGILAHQNERIIYLEREIMFLLEVFDFIQKIFTKFDYHQRIFINYKHGNVESYNLTTSDIFDKYHSKDHLVQTSDFVISRIVSLGSFDSKVLTGSILEELARTCDWPVDEGEFKGHINKIFQERFS